MYEEQLEFKDLITQKQIGFLFQDLLLVIRSTSPANSIVIVGCHCAGSFHTSKL